MTNTATVVRRVSRLLLVVVLVAMLPTAGQPGQDEKKDEKKEKPVATITPTRAWGNVFGDQEVEFKFRVDAMKPIKGTLAWRLSLDTATVQANTIEIAAGPNAPQEIAFKLTRLPGKEGAIVESKFTLTITEPGKAQPTATYEQDLWVFPKDPFKDRTEWLKKLKINLYDPTAKGATAKLFEKTNIPFEQLQSVQAVADVKEGIVIVGEGVSFKEEKGLAAALQKLAAAGIAVLILAPAEGEVLVPGLGGPGGLDDLTFRREIVRKFDKRLDPDGWMGEGNVVASTIAIRNSDDGVIGEVTAKPGGWPWIEARYGPGKGRWAVCGLAIVAKWEDGPTPRFLFTRMLEYLTDSETEKPKKENE